MWHLVFVSVHALAAITAVVVAVLALLAELRAHRRRTLLLRAHTICIGIMSGALPLSIIAGWAGFTNVSRPIFIGLFVLSTYMLWRAVRAEGADRSNDRPLVIHHLGFDLIGLTTGFLAVAALWAGAGMGGIIAVAVGIPVLGHFVVHRLRARAARAASPATTAG